jgi:hypothetical protein
MTSIFTATDTSNCIVKCSFETVNDIWSHQAINIFCNYISNPGIFNLYSVLIYGSYNI